MKIKAPPMFYLAAGPVQLVGRLPLPKNREDTKDLKKLCIGSGYFMDDLKSWSRSQSRTNLRCRMLMLLSAAIA